MEETLQELNDKQTELENLLKDSQFKLKGISRTLSAKNSNYYDDLDIRIRTIRSEIRELQAVEYPAENETDVLVNKYSSSANIPI